MLFQTNRFKKAYKKLNANQLVYVNKAIDQIMSNPLIGEQKKGDLVWLRVYKFNMAGQLALIGYYVEQPDKPSDEMPETSITLVDIGSHENFYRDLKRY